MPKRYTATARETVDLHRDTWSDAKDPETGRYLERVTIYTKLLYADQQWIQNRLFAAMAGEEIDLGSLTDPQSGAVSLPKLSFAQVAQSGNSDDALFRAVVEITDEAGDPLPWRDTNGNLLEDAARQTLDEMDSADVQFILQEVNRRISVQPVPVLPADRQAAQIGDPAAADGRGAAGVAEAAFRGGGESGLS